MKWKLLAHLSLELEVLARTTDETGVNYLRWFPWCRAIRMYRVIKVLGVLPELRTRVNSSFPEQTFELYLAVKDLKMVSNLIDRFNRIAPPFFNAITLSEEVNKVKLKFLFVVVSNVGGLN